MLVPPVLMAPPPGKPQLVGDVPNPWANKTRGMCVHPNKQERKMELERFMEMRFQ
jgi:hypothetical protein